MAESNKFTAVWERFFLAAGSVVFLVAFCILLATGDRVHRNVANWKLFVVNLLILAILCAGSLFMRGRKREWEHPVLTLLGIYVLLFILQCVFVHFTYFYTGWDVDLMKWRVEGMLDGYSLQELGGDDYLSIFPNNLLLFYVQYLLAGAGSFFSMEAPYNLCIYGSCFCVAASCFFGSLVMRKVTRNGLILLLYDLTSTIFIVFCPWIVIPYSDTYGMLFVSLGIWAMYCLERPALRWPALAFAALIGYHIKPTCVFTLLAAVILCLPGLLGGRWKELGILLLSCLLFLGAGQGITLWVQHDLKFSLYPERKCPPIHYIMMGLNTDTKGGFSADDYDFTVSISTYEEKNRQIREVIERRWSRMTLSQKREHFRAKLIYILNNGTFSWGDEGVFFCSVPEHDNGLNDMYTEIFYPEGKYFVLYCEAAQVIWMQILLGIALLFLDFKNQTFHKAFLAVVLCGLLAFLMLFEARARYLILYSPAFLILSLQGYEGLFTRIALWRGRGA